MGAEGQQQIILDAYNANPTSMRAAIKNFAAAQLPHKMLWLGGMKEMGPDERKEHEELVAFIDQYQWDNVILVGKEFRGTTDKHILFDTSPEAAEHIKKKLPENAAILVKGSRGSKMEVMLEALS